MNVFGVVLAKSYGEGESTSFLVIAAGVLSGILLHDIGLMAIVSVTRKAMNRKVIKTLTMAAGVLLIGFAGYFIYEFIQAIKVYI